jgi:hypothetical protein
MPAQALLDMGAAVNARDKSGGTPLAITAEERGRGPAAAALLAAGANVRAKNAAGEAPLYIAALRGHHDLVQLLLAHHELHNIAWTVRVVAVYPASSILVVHRAALSAGWWPSGERFAECAHLV